MWRQQGVIRSTIGRSTAGNTGLPCLLRIMTYITGMSIITPITTKAISACIPPGKSVKHHKGNSTIMRIHNLETFFKILLIHRLCKDYKEIPHKWQTEAQLPIIFDRILISQLNHKLQYPED